MMDEVPKKTVLVNFSFAMYSFVYTWWFGDTGLGLALYCPVQSSPVWCGL